MVDIFIGQGYYFASSWEISQRDLTREAGRILHAHGLVPIKELKRLGIETVGKMRGGSS